MERSGLTFEHFCFLSGLKSPCKKSVFFADFALVHPPMALVLLEMAGNSWTLLELLERAGKG